MSALISRLIWFLASWDKSEVAGIGLCIWYGTALDGDRPLRALFLVVAFSIALGYFAQTVVDDRHKFILDRRQARVERWSRRWNRNR